MELCWQDETDAKVFHRQFTHAHITLDCGAFEANLDWEHDDNEPKDVVTLYEWQPLSVWHMTCSKWESTERCFAYIANKRDY